MGDSTDRQDRVTLRIIARQTLKAFWEVHRDSELPLRAWFKEACQADWSSPAEIKALYRSASIVADNRVVFNIAGNKYRLVVKFNYAHRVGYVRFVGTHAEYDRIDVAKI